MAPLWHSLSFLNLTDLAGPIYDLSFRTQPRHPRITILQVHHDLSFVSKLLPVGNRITEMSFACWRKRIAVISR